VLENLRNIFDSGDPTCQPRGPQTDLLNDYLSDYLVKRGLSKSRRNISKAAISESHKRNEAAPNGRFGLAAATMPLDGVSPYSETLDHTETPDQVLRCPAE